MILTTKGRYAVMAMVDLALHQKERPVGLAAIADRQEIPLAYLEQIFAKLKRAGLVASVRGPGGGYTLAVCWGGDFGGGAEFAVPVAAELHAPARGGAGLADGARAGSEGGEFADGEGGGAVREVGGHKAGREDR